MNKALMENYSAYLEILRGLAKRPSVFTDSMSVREILSHCKSLLERYLPSFHVRFDAMHNLIALPGNIDTEKNIVYLSAHIDTVDAKPEEWDSPFKPFDVFEDEREMVARGVSDCKAGVAYELFLGRLQSLGPAGLRNIVFTITCNEEGAGTKTAVEIGKSLGHELPLSNSATYLIVLENTVKATAPPTLCIYDRERGNWVVKLKGTIAELQKYLKRLDLWNPVCIRPDQGAVDRTWGVFRQESRHACSVPRDSNLLTNILLKAKDSTLIRAGQEENFGVIPAEIQVSQSNEAETHHVILSNRGFYTRREIESQLNGIPFEAMKDFSISPGLDVKDRIAGDKISRILRQAAQDGMEIETGHNIGCSDASIIWNAMDDSSRKNFYPLVMGPGTRSQPDSKPPRYTHGKNETFDKESGKQTLVYITQVLAELGCVYKR